MLYRSFNCSSSLAFSYMTCISCTFLIFMRVIHPRANLWMVMVALRMARSAFYLSESSPFILSSISRWFSIISRSVRSFSSLSFSRIILCLSTDEFRLVIFLLCIVGGLGGMSGFGLSDWLTCLAFVLTFLVPVDWPSEVLSPARGFRERAEFVWVGLRGNWFELDFCELCLW